MRPLLRALAALLVCSALLASPALAVSLSEAKAQGLVGERADGFVGIVVADPSAEIARLVEQVNTQRRQKYEEIAQERGTPMDAVAKIVGETQMQKARPGEFVAGADGRWRQK